MSSLDKCKQCFEMPNCEERIVVMARYHAWLSLVEMSLQREKRLKIQQQERGITDFLWKLPETEGATAQIWVGFR